MPERKDIAAQIRGSLRWLWIATGGLFIIVLVAIVAVWIYSNQTNSALCTLRSSYQLRADKGDAYVKNHPHGIPRLGISKAQIEASVADDRRTATALSDLRC